MDQGNNNMKINLIAENNNVPSNSVYKGTPYMTNSQNMPYHSQINFSQSVQSPYQSIPVTNFQQTWDQSNFSIHPQYQPNNFSDNCIQHLVRTLPPTERKNLNEYCFVKCPNVTTAWINSYGFSYLTSFSNDENYYFCPRTDYGFNLNSWTERSTNNKVTREKLKEFIVQLNTQFKISQNIQTARNAIKKRRLIFSLLTIINLILFIICLGAWMDFFPDYLYLKDGSIVLAMFCSIFCGFMFFFSLFCCCKYSFAKNNYVVDKILISKTDGIENFINSWNNQYFLPCGLYVMAPRNLNYLQFVLDNNIKFSLQDHPYPFDLIPNRNNNCSI